MVTEADVLDTKSLSVRELTPFPRFQWRADLFATSAYQSATVGLFSAALFSILRAPFSNDPRLICLPPDVARRGRSASRSCAVRAALALQTHLTPAIDPEPHSASAQRAACPGVDRKGLKLVQIDANKPMLALPAPRGM